MLAAVRQDQVLHGKLNIDHAARAVFDVKLAHAHRMTGPHLCAHAAYLLAQTRCGPLGADDGFAHCIKAAVKRGITQNTAGARHGLVLPGPGGVAATLLLVVGVGLKAGDQQTRASVWAQGGVDLVQITLTSLHGEPVDKLANQSAVRSNFRHALRFHVLQLGRCEFQRVVPPCECLD